MHVGAMKWLAWTISWHSGQFAGSPSSGYLSCGAVSGLGVTAFAVGSSAMTARSSEPDMKLAAGTWICVCTTKL